MGQKVENEGTLTSVARDFSLVSRWGKLSWKGELAEGTSISFQTRSGNSEVPDDTWSSWSAPLASPEGSQISSPPGRFIQYRANLKSSAGGASPSLREVNLSGLQENVSPQILTIGVNPLGGKENGAIKGNDKSKGRHNGSEGGIGMWEISWAAGDVNNDRLVYDLLF